MILIDTHVAIWIATDSEPIGPDSRAILEDSAAQDRLLVSAISFWEIALLISKQRLLIDKPPGELRFQVLDAGITELPLTGRIAILAAELGHLHPDPADRFIVATAIVHGATLMTTDAALLRWPHSLQRIDPSR